LFFELALADLTQAADLFRPIYDATDGVDGWVSLEVSPLLAYDTARSIKEATELCARAKRPNLFIKIPGTPEGLPAIEETIFIRSAGECHALVLARALHRGGRRIHARDRATDRSRPPPGGRNLPEPEPSRSDCCGPAPVPKTLKPQISFTSRRWQLQTLLTPCPRRRYSLSPITAK